MKTYRENPDGEENQKAQRDNERYIFALKMEEHKHLIEKQILEDELEEIQLLQEQNAHLNL